jgi:dTDP-4-amino-4,6-dideoxygalactose transaminase
LTHCSVPFYRLSLSSQELEAVASTLRSGWLTTGPRTLQFEKKFAEAVGATNAVALNSCTAALHLAVESLGLRDEHAVLVPTMTFAATAEAVRYQRATPILVDCDEVTMNLDLLDAEKKLCSLGEYIHGESADRLKMVGIMPVHVGGFMIDVDELKAFAARNSLWIVEDAAHAFPSAWRQSSHEVWQRCGERTADISCFSFYANKTITTGEGGMAVTDNQVLSDRMRIMSLHGLSGDSWSRHSGVNSWDYRIIAPGYKYNMTDIAAAIGIHQLRRAEEMRKAREKIARQFIDMLASVDEIELPIDDVNRISAWHIFQIRLRLEDLHIDRNSFMKHLKRRGVSSSVHWRPLHLHPYYQKTFGWKPEHCPVATRVWERLISLPIFADMRDAEIEHVVCTVTDLCREYARIPQALMSST